MEDLAETAAAIGREALHSSPPLPKSPSPTNPPSSSNARKRREGETSSSGPIRKKQKVSDGPTRGFLTEPSSSKSRLLQKKVVSLARPSPHAKNNLMPLKAKDDIFDEDSFYKTVRPGNIKRVRKRQADEDEGPVYQQDISPRKGAKGGKATTQGKGTSGRSNKSPGQMRKKPVRAGEDIHNGSDEDEEEDDDDNDESESPAKQPATEAGPEGVDEEDLRSEAGPSNPTAPESEAQLDERMLLGQIEDWRQVHKKCRQILSSGIDTKLVHTNKMKSIQDNIKKARTVFKKISERREEGASTQDLEGQLSGWIQQLDDDIGSIARPSKLVKRRNTVQDLYVAVLPPSIVMLKYAMRSRIRKSEERPYTALHLAQIIQLQNLILRAIETVHAWKEGPDAVVPITQPVKQGIYPKLRDINKAFKKQLQDIRRVERVESNHARYFADVLQSEPGPGTESFEKGLVHQKYLQGMFEEISQWRKHSTQFQPTLRKVTSSNDRSGDGWTADEDYALVAELCNNRKTRELPAEERYVAILSSSETLQMKLPEHIKERALQLKPTIIESYLRLPKYKNKALPYYIMSIE